MVALEGNLFSLKGETVVLTGATGYIGAYFGEALVRHGARVLLIGRSKDKLHALKKKLVAIAGEDKIAGYVLDQYEREECERLYRDILSKERVDVLVNNSFDFSRKTGFNDPSGKLESATHDQFAASFESGVYWAAQTTQLFGAAMKKQGKGSIVNVCTMYAVVVPAPDLYEGTNVFNPPGYSMGKAGLLQFTKYCASFLSPEVRVNALSPGAIPNTETESANAVVADNPVLTRLTRKILLKRIGHPTDLTGALIFLASDASAYVTGQNIIVDGGLTVT